MIKFGNLIIEGYGSIEKYEITLDNGYINIIKGPNGYGKTTLLSSIAWVIYGKTLKEDVTEVNTWPRLRTKEYQGTKVELYFNSGTSINQIVRCSNYTGKVEGSKGGNRLIYKVDGVEVKNKKKLEIQALIEADIKMSFNLFKNSIMFGQGLKRIIQESNSDKKQLFEEVFDVGYLSDSRKYAQKQMGVLNEKLNKLLPDYREAKVRYESAWNTYKELIDIESSRISDFEEDLRLIDKEVKQAEKVISQWDPSRLNLLAKAMEEKARLTDKLDKLTSSYNENKGKVTSFTNITGLKELISKISKLILKNPKKAIQLLSDLESAILNVSSYSDKREELFQKIKEKTNLIKDIESDEEDYKDAVKEKKELKSKLEKLKSKEHKITSTKYKAQAKSHRKKMKSLWKEIEPLQKEIADYDWVIKDPLGNNGIKSYIFESSLGELNNTLDTYSNILGLKVEFSVDLSNTRKDFYTLVELRGMIVNYSELSGGQKQLINLAMALAMWESASNSKDINILFLDEIFESLSSDNIEIVVELIKFISKGKSIYIITHHDSLPIGGNTKTITLAYKNGLTSFN